MENLMPKNIGIVRPGRVLLVGIVEDNMTVEHKVWEKQLAARDYDPTSWLISEEDCGSPTRGSPSGNTIHYIIRCSPASRTPLPFSLVMAEHLPPQLASFTLMDYKVPDHAFIKKDNRKGRNPLLSNYVGHVGMKPVYDTDGPLEYMDGIIILTDRGVWELTT
jgi:hypothetical protein